jgi:hypothetical protein
MYRIHSCPCCRSTDLASLPAVVAPFLAHYAVGAPPSRCSLLECRRCDFRFFDSRLAEDEVARLYAGYRGEEYFRARRRYESWYTRKFNAKIGHDANAIAARRHTVESLVAAHVDLQSIHTVLDYGGDEGQFIPQAVGADKYVFELSDAIPILGVTKIESEERLRGRRFDLVMLCHVLEHCSEPLVALRIVKELASGPSLCYVELPYERIDFRFAGRGWLYERYLGALLHLPPLLELVDFYSTVVRVRRNAIPPLGIIKCHEHLNFFNEKSLDALLRSAGFEVLTCGAAPSPTFMASGKVLQALARSRVEGADQP